MSQRRKSCKKNQVRSRFTKRCRKPCSPTQTVHRVTKRCVSRKLRHIKSRRVSRKSRRVSRKSRRVSRKSRRVSRKSRRNSGRRVEKDGVVDFIKNAALDSLDKIGLKAQLKSMCEVCKHI
jgi:hypothetical protein